MQVLYLPKVPDQSGIDSIRALLEEAFTVIGSPSVEDAQTVIGFQGKDRMYAFSTFVAHESTLGYVPGVVKFRESGIPIPLVILTDHDSRSCSITDYLDAGADYAVCISPRADIAIQATVRAAVRHAHGLASNVVRYGDLALYLKERQIFADNDRMVDVTSTLYRLLEALLIRRGGVLSKSEVLHVLYGEERYPDSNVEHVQITKVRRALRMADSTTTIGNCRELGYHLEAAT